MNIENKIAADDLRSHKKLADDVRLMAEKLAIFDGMVEAIEYLLDRDIDYCHPFAHTRKQREILEKAKELQRGAINNDF